MKKISKFNVFLTSVSLSILLIIAIIVLYNKSNKYNFEIDPSVKEYIIQNKLLKKITDYDASVPEPESFYFAYGTDINGIEKVILLEVKDENNISVLDSIDINENILEKRDVKRKMLDLGYDENKYEFAVCLFQREHGKAKLEQFCWDIEVLEKDTLHQVDKYCFEFLSGKSID